MIPPRPVWRTRLLARVLRWAHYDRHTWVDMETLFGFGALGCLSLMLLLWVVPSGRPCLVMAGVSLSGFLLGLGGSTLHHQLAQGGWFPVTQSHIDNGLLREEANPTLRHLWEQQDGLLWRDLMCASRPRPDFALDDTDFDFLQEDCLNWRVWEATGHIKRSPMASFAYAEANGVAGGGRSP
jgi:hypothetical protein